MITKIKQLITVFALGFTLLVPVLAVGTAGAQIQESLCSGANLGDAGTPGDCTEDSGGTDINGIVNFIVDTFSWIVGIVSVIMIIFGGFRYITSGGDSSKVTNAKNTIIYAIIGLVIVALAQFIVNFVVSKATTTGA